MMSGKIALDTDIAIKFLNGDKTIEIFLSKYSEFYLPVIVAGELIFGAMNSKHAKENLIRHKKLISRTEILEIKETTANSYANIRLFLKKKGKPIPENDLWIASLCIEHNIPLISNDMHFGHIANLKLKRL